MLYKQLASALVALTEVPLTGVSGPTFVPQTGSGAKRQRLGGTDRHHRPPGATRPGGAVQGGPSTLQLPQHLPAGGPQRGLGAGDGRQVVGGTEGHR